MADSDEPRGDAPADDDLGEAFVEPGRRRSTYTPPPHLAQRAAPVPVPVPVPDPVPEPETDQTDAVAAPDTDMPVFSNAPEPAAVTALPRIPERRSLTDRELTDELSDATEQTGSALEALDVLESQLRLRVEEAQEYRDWEQTMLAIGTPEALAEVETVRPRFVEVVAITTSIPVQYPEVAPAPAASEPEAAPAAPAPAAPEVPWNPPTLIEPPAPEPEAPFDFDALFAPETAADESAPEPSSDPLADLTEPFDASGPVQEIPPLRFVEPMSPEAVAETAGEAPIEAAPVGAAPVEEAPATPASFSFDALLAPEPEGTDSAAESELLQPYVTAFALTPEPVVATPDSTTVATPDATTVAPAAVETPAAGYAAASSGFTAEEIGSLPTPIEQRVGRAVQLFWLWFAANSSVVSVAFGAILFSLGMSLRQAVIATLIGLVLSFVPLGLGTLSGKRSGQPTMIVSRATFGVHGNVLPALIALVSRVFWGSALLWVLGASVAAGLVGAGVTGGFGENKLVILTMGVGFILALIVAFFGFRVIAAFQLVVSIVSVVLIAGLVWLTWPYIDVEAALTTPDGSLTLVLTGAVLVFSFIGLVWANSAGDLARYQRAGTGSAGSMLWASFGTTLPTFALISYGALLAASDPAIAAGLLSNPVDTIGGMLPNWYPIPLVAAVALSLLSGVVVSIYSGSFALAATGLRIKQTVSTLVIAVLVFVFGWLISTAGTDLLTLFRDLATTIAVPVAAWAGIFAAEVMIRGRRYDAASLLKTGGIYPAVRWVNLGALVVISGIGYGLTTATITGLGWEGYILRVAGIGGDLAASDFGVLVALLLGLLVPLVAGIGAIRRQETADSVAPAVAPAVA